MLEIRIFSINMNLIVLSNQILLALAIGVTVDNENVRKMELQDNDQNASQMQRSEDTKCSKTDDDVQQLIPIFVNFLHEFSIHYKIGFLGLCLNNPRFENGKFLLVQL